MRLALLAALLLTGCTPTRFVYATNPAEIAAASAAVVGQTADVTLVSGIRSRGEVQYLRPDSTAWSDEASVFAVPTAEVRSLVVDTRRRALARGALIGGGSAFALCTLGGAAITTSISDGAGADGNEVLLIGALCTPIGATLGLIGGALTSRRTEIVLYGPAGTGGDAAGPSD